MRPPREKAFALWPSRASRSVKDRLSPEAILRIVAQQLRYGGKADGAAIHSASERLQSWMWRKLPPQSFTIQASQLYRRQRRIEPGRRYDGLDGAPLDHFELSLRLTGQRG